MVTTSIESARGRRWPTSRDLLERVGVAALERRTGGRLLFLDYAWHGMPQGHLPLPDAPRRGRRTAAGRATRTGSA